MIDTHCHLNYIDGCGTVAGMIDEAAQNGVGKIINIGADLPSSEISCQLANQFDSVYAAVGVHPHDAKTVNNTILDKLKELSANNKVVTIGEIGLDYYRDLSPRPIQKQAFVQQLELAVEVNLPVVIHTRDSFEDTVDIISDYAPLLKGGVFHCFPGTIDDAIRVIEMGFVISVGGVITFKKATMADVAREVPLESVILETDAPYLTPVPYRGKTNRPAYVKYVYEHIAQLRNLTLTEVETTVDKTASKLFGLEETFGG